MLTPFPLCSSQCVAPTTLSRWGVSAWNDNGTRDVLNSKSLPVQCEEGVKKYPLFFFLPGVLYFSVHNCLMMLSHSRDPQIAYLNRPSEFYSHSSAQKNKGHISVRPYWLAVHQPDSAPWIDEAMNVGFQGGFPGCSECACASVLL